MKYVESIEKFQLSIDKAIRMLQHDPHFKVFVELIKQGRENMVQDLCGEGMNEKDIDRLRGAIYLADEIIRNTQVNDNNGNGTRNAGIDSDEQYNRG